MEKDDNDNTAYMEFNWRKNFGTWNASLTLICSLGSFRGALPVGERLIECHIAADLKCKRCGCIESITHLLFHCQFAQKV